MGYVGRKLKRYICLFFAPILLSLFSCDKENDIPDLPEVQAERTILVYAITSNSLSYFFDDDLAEMERAMQGIDTDKFRLLVFNAGYRRSESGFIEHPVTRSEPTLSLFKKDGKKIERITLKTYKSDLYATDPERVKEVVRDMQELCPAVEYGLILWSHAMGWNPVAKSISAPEKRYFGDDAGEHMDIDRLSIALPDNLFRFIWMDCCYMANIETIYQLRNKARYYVGSPTETLGEGAPYHLVLPYLMSPVADECAAAHAMFNYYNMMSGLMRSCTISVFDLSKVHDVSEKAKDIFCNYSPVTADGILKYSRYSHGPFYDFGQFARKTADEHGNTSAVDPFMASMDEFVLLKLATPSFLYGEGGFVIDVNNFSGVSCHRLVNDGSDQEKYYMTLDWFRDVFPDQH